MLTSEELLRYPQMTFVEIDSVKSISSFTEERQTLYFCFFLLCLYDETGLYFFWGFFLTVGFYFAHIFVYLYWKRKILFGRFLFVIAINEE